MASLDDSCYLRNWLQPRRQRVRAARNDTWRRRSRAYTVADPTPDSRELISLSMRFCSSLLFWSLPLRAVHAAWSFPGARPSAIPNH